MEGKEEICASDIISILHKASGQYVSGEYLSKCLGITRTAVWKRIGALKKEGYNIEASTRKGYRLVSPDLPYGKVAIQQHLNTRLFGRNMEFFRAIDSTNNYLKRLANEGAAEGTVVVADCQIQGRGRLGRNWVSEPGQGIWMSVLTRPWLHPNDVQIFTLAASAAVCNALDAFGISGMGIKWPNDIMIKGKKVCGILTELAAEAERVLWVVTGIGINVNQLSFPTEIESIATSLRLNTAQGDVLDRSRLAAMILNELEKIYNKFIESGSEIIIDNWKRWNITLGRRVRLVFKGESLEANAYDILSDGRLVAIKDDGTKLEAVSGEISLREV